MSSLASIPFAKLDATDAINARAATKEGIDELAASIALKGLIQPLAVRPVDGSADRFEVIDGRRRYQALAKLVRFKRRPNGGETVARTSGKAWSLSTGRAVVPIEGVKGSVPLDELTVQPATEGAAP